MDGRLARLLAGKRVGRLVRSGEVSAAAAAAAAERREEDKREENFYLEAFQ